MVEDKVDRIELPCIEGRQHGRKIYVCTIPGSVLADLYSRKVIDVDEWTPQHRDGYQRTPVVTRARRFARFISDKGEKGISPTSLLLYQRDITNGVHYDNGNLVIPFSDNMKNPLLYIVDGQHRTLGISEGYLHGILNYEIEFDIPVVVLVGDKSIDPYIEEASQFITINTTQKRVRTDLANQQLLKIRSAKSGIISANSQLIVGTKKELQPFATAIVNTLTDDEKSPWFGKIVRPGTARAESGLPSQGQFEDSLMDSYIGSSLIDFGASGGYNIGEMVTVLGQYWAAIFELMPNSIENPKNYYVTKTLGIHALNALLPSIFMLKRLDKIPVKEDFKKILNKIESFSEDQWITGGEIGSYGGGKSAFRNLTIELHKQLLET
ncbi:DGQHR domain-containing protein [Methanocalculus sp.]|uniref:DGQHR domain-containing protein n=1 Tax=Methanocalculus sp. TaxID=2004547 RepID=UPI00260AE534|nr:DGQHR domain-containing protein [Methanocalculus sp.]MDG6249840.1 DGQHR domain-containing protein [Methanocalculus sp.]